MSDIINVTDPKGRNIRCTRDCWYGHVLIRHPFLHKSMKSVIRTITRPDFINSDRTSSTVEIYYRKIANSSGEYYYRIAVEFNGGNGEIKTVYKRNSTKTGETQIWP